MTRAPLRSLILATALTAAGSAAAQTVVPPSTVPVAPIPPARLALGLDLAKLLNSEATLLTMLEKILVESMPASLLANADVAAMERQYPGLVAEISEAMRAPMMAHLTVEVPRLWDRLAAFYAGNRYSGADTWARRTRRRAVEHRCAGSRRSQQQ